MKKTFFFLILFILFSKVFSQDIEEDFLLPKPEKIKSMYSKLVVIDARADTTNMGIIQKGAFNKKAFLKPRIALKNQIETVFNDMLDVNSGSGELLLYLREFKFAEVTGAFEENGYCNLRADLFLKKDTLYQKIDAIDTVLKVGAMDVTKKNLKNGSDKLIGFLMSNVTQIKNGSYYTFEDIKNIEFVEKRNIPIYNTKEYVNGVYTTYESFKNQNSQIPNYTIKKNKKGKITEVMYRIEDGSFYELRADEIYAVIDEGKILISTSKGYLPVEFKEGDFYFQGKAKVTGNTGNIVMATMFFGIIGGIIASESSAEFQFKIDYVNGTPLQQSEIIK